MRIVATPGAHKLPAAPKTGSFPEKPGSRKGPFLQILKISFLRIRLAVIESDHSPPPFSRENNEETSQIRYRRQPVGYCHDIGIFN
jgi:hypothetical protein